VAGAGRAPGLSRIENRVEPRALIRRSTPRTAGRSAPWPPAVAPARAARRPPCERGIASRRPGRAIPRVSFLLVLLALAAARPGRAEVLGTLSALEVRGNQSVDRELIASSTRLAPGSAVSRDDVQEALRRLYGLGLFDDVDIYGEETGPGQVRLIVDVAEKRRVGRIEFTGNEKIDDAGLKEKLTVKEGQIFDDRVLAEQTKALAAAYKEKGYSQVQIGSEVAASEADGPGRVALTFRIDEGRKVKVAEVRLSGAEGLDLDRLRKGIKTKKKGLLWGGDYKEEQLRADLETVTANLHNMGYKDAKEPTYTLDFDPDEPRLTIDIRIEPGPFYTMGPATWSGNTIIGTAQLERQVAWLPGDPYSEEKISTTVSNAYSAYAEEGYIYVGVEPQKTVTDRSVALEFRVTEGEPSMVRQVRVTGNTRTKEKVVRRQLVIRPGDRFSRTALVRSQREVFQLGFFEDVKVDFERAGQGTSDIDIVFEVKEKQTGTLQAGAGFSSAGGLTGFVEMGHNNLFGNGQQLNLKIEAGGRSGQQDVSFTEPWFMDTPTSVGFDLFNTRIRRDIYDDRRRGGAIRLGRPLP
jgi:outer membrane protein insertion porin family